MKETTHNVAVETKKKRPLSREEQATLEVGVTEISLWQKRVVIVFMLFGIFSVPVTQTIRELRSGKTPQALSIFATVPKTCSMVFRGKSSDDPKMEITAADGAIARVFKANAVALSDIHRYEDGLDDGSILTKTVLSPAQGFLTRALQAGNEEAYPGLGKWLFYRSGIDTLTGRPFLSDRSITLRAQSGNEWRRAPQPDPLIAIFNLNLQLAKKGIQLVLMPAPVKGQIHPEQFSSRYRKTSVPLYNPSYAQFLEELAEPDLFFARYERFLSFYRDVPLEKQKKCWYWPMMEAVDALAKEKALLKQHKVLLVDVAPTLVEAKERGQIQYLEADTHWRPEAMERAAGEVKTFLEKHTRLSAPPVGEYVRTTLEVTNLGDVAVMMQLPETQKLYEPESVTIHPVTVDGRPYQNTPGAEVLVLGDSFGNIYSLEGMGWGKDAGLVPQLAYELKRPIDAFLRNDAGAFSTREMLMRELARDPDHLANTRVVLWEFAAREFSVGDWRVLTPRVAEQMVQPDSDNDDEDVMFIEIEVGQAVALEGTIAEVSAPPDKSAPYKDHVMEVYLKNVKCAVEGVTLSGNAAYVAVLSMKDRTLLAPSTWKVGQVVEMELENYDEINTERKIRELKSSALENEDLFDATLLWGTVKEPAADEQAPPAGWPEAMGLLLTLGISALVVSFAEKREKRAAEN